MNRRGVLQSMGLLLAAGAAFLTSRSASAGLQKATKEMHAHCAKACAACAKACMACAKHCESMVAAGQKEHERTLRLSQDSADVCAAAARICGRGGPTTVLICETCAAICDECGAACGKYPNMRQMKECAESCAACSRACREMIKAIKG